MDAEQFRKAGHELVDWIADYYTNIEKYRVFPGMYQVSDRLRCSIGVDKG